MAASLAAFFSYFLASFSAANSSLALA